MSVWAKGTGTLNLEAGNSTYGFKFIELSNVTEWTKYSWTFTAGEDDVSAVGNQTNIYFGHRGSSGTLQLCGMKLEEDTGFSDKLWDNVSGSTTTLVAQWTINSYKLVKSLNYNNLISNGTFSSYSITDPPTKTANGVTHTWDGTLNGVPGNTSKAYNVTGWGTGINTGVSVPEIGYHAHMKLVNGNAIFDFKTNEAYSGQTQANVSGGSVTNGTIYTGRWSGISQDVTDKITAGKTYMLSVDVYRVSGNNMVTGGLYYATSSNTTKGFQSGQMSLRPSKTGQWQTLSYTFTVASDYLSSSGSSIFIYGYTGGIGEFYIDNVVLEEVPSVTTKTYNSAYTSSELASASATGYTFGGWYNTIGLGTKLTTSHNFTTSYATFDNVAINGSIAKIYADFGANALTFANQSISKNFSASAQTASVTAASNGTGTYTYSEVSEKNSGGTATSYISLSGTTITIAANTPASTYTYVIRATDSGTGKTKDATYTITVNKVAATITCSNKTFSGSAQTGCTCSGGTIGGTYSATSSGTYTASCTPDSNHTAPANKSWTISCNTTISGTKSEGQTVTYGGRSWTVKSVSGSDINLAYNGKIDTTGNTSGTTTGAYTGANAAVTTFLQDSTSTYAIIKDAYAAGCIVNNGSSSNYSKGYTAASYWTDSTHFYNATARNYCPYPTLVAYVYGANTYRRSGNPGTATAWYTSRGATSTSAANDIISTSGTHYSVSGGTVTFTYANCGAASTTHKLATAASSFEFSNSLSSPSCTASASRFCYTTRYYNMTMSNGSAAYSAAVSTTGVANGHKNTWYRCDTDANHGKTITATAKSATTFTYTNAVTSSNLTVTTNTSDGNYIIGFAGNATMTCPGGTYCTASGSYYDRIYYHSTSAACANRTAYAASSNATDKLYYRPYITVKNYK